MPCSLSAGSLAATAANLCKLLICANLFLSTKLSMHPHHVALSFADMHLPWLITDYNNQLYSYYMLNKIDFQEQDSLPPAKT